MRCPSHLIASHLILSWHAGRIQVWSEHAPPGMFILCLIKLCVCFCFAKGKEEGRKEGKRVPQISKYSVPQTQGLSMYVSIPCTLVNYRLNSPVVSVQNYRTSGPLYAACAQVQALRHCGTCTAQLARRVYWVIVPRTGIRAPTACRTTRLFSQKKDACRR